MDGFVALDCHGEICNEYDASSNIPIIKTKTLQIAGPQSESHCVDTGNEKKSVSWSNCNL